MFAAVPKYHISYVALLAAVGAVGVYKLYLGQTERYAGVEFKAYPEPSLGKLLEAPNWKVDDIKDVDAIIAKHLD